MEACGSGLPLIVNKGVHQAAQRHELYNGNRYTVIQNSAVHRSTGLETGAGVRVAFIQTSRRQLRLPQRVSGLYRHRYTFVVRIPSIGLLTLETNSVGYLLRRYSFTFDG